jgi:chemotaxis protein CheX
MQFLEQEIRQVTETVWDTVLGITLTPELGVPAMPPRMVSGCVQFSGAWDGAVTIECSAEFARQAAATMFGMDASQATPSDTRDAIGELANMTGGNVKALLPEPCRLSLPTVMEGEDCTTHVHGSDLVTTVAFDCGGTPLVVRLHKKLDTP